ncbi:MAG: pyridoxamine 5'-phosphate oxidase family protein [Clostridia bacterium]|nr:pyridoxamine 5'-phosphate oxidase family protein [Clostridia bacterium]
MQHRMKTHALTKQEMEQLLQRAQTGSLATLSPDGTPYVTPVHFVHFDGAVYFHGLPKGKKLENIARNPRVGFSVYEMETLLLDPNGKPCDTNTEYKSVIISGTARLLDDIVERSTTLRRIVEKYTPHLAGNSLSDSMARGTAVIRIDVTEMTGKYFP